MPTAAERINMFITRFEHSTLLCAFAMAELQKVMSLNATKKAKAEAEWLKQLSSIITSVTKVTKLKKNGKNFEAWEMIMMASFKALKLKKAFNFVLPKKGKKKYEIGDLLSALDPTNQTKLINLPLDVQKKAIRIACELEESKDFRDAAALGFVVALGDENAWLVKSAPKDPATTWATVRAHFGPAGEISVRSLHKIMNEAWIGDHENNFSVLAAADAAASLIALAAPASYPDVRPSLGWLVPLLPAVACVAAVQLQGSAVLVACGGA